MSVLKGASFARGWISSGRFYTRRSFVKRVRDEGTARRIMMKRLIILIVSFFCLQHLYAADFKFETTSEGITKALIKQKTQRKIKTRSLTETTDVKMRSIRVVGKEHGKLVEKTMIVPENEPIQGVNLKIEFDYDSYAIRPESYPLLNELGKALTGEHLKGHSMIIKGHTDSDGEKTYNLKLSLNRAFVVKLYLTSHFSIDSSLLKVVGYGEGLPLVPNDSPENKQINRRVEIAARP